MFNRSFVLLTILAIVVSVLALFAMPAAAAIGPQPLEECPDMQLGAEYMDYGNGVQDVAFGWTEVEGAYSYEVYVYDASGKLVLTLKPAAGWRWGLLPAASLAEGGPFNVVILAKNPAGAPLCQANLSFTFELPAGKKMYDAQASHPGPAVPLPKWLTDAQPGHAPGGAAPDGCAVETGKPDGCACTADAECAANCDLNSHTCSATCLPLNMGCSSSGQCCSGYCEGTLGMCLTW